MIIQSENSFEKMKNAVVIQIADQHVLLHGRKYELPDIFFFEKREGLPGSRLQRTAAQSAVVETYKLLRRDFKVFLLKIKPNGFIVIFYREGEYFFIGIPVKPGEFSFFQQGID